MSRKIGWMACAVLLGPPTYTIETQPGTSGTYTVTGLFYVYPDGSMEQVPRPLPWAPEYGSEFCAVFPDLCVALNQQRAADEAWNAERLAEIRGAQVSGDPDFNGNGVVDSADFHLFLVRYFEQANGGR